LEETFVLKKSVLIWNAKKKELALQTKRNEKMLLFSEKVSLPQLSK